MMSHAVANILFAISNSVPKGTGKYWPFLTTMQAYRNYSPMDLPAQITLISQIFLLKFQEFRMP